MENRFFFKFIKQNLTIKKLWGHSENAVKIHIWVAIITYLLIAYVKKILKSPLSIYEMIELLGISLFDKTPIQDLISDTEIELYINNLNYLILKKSTQQ